MLCKHCRSFRTHCHVFNKTQCYSFGGLISNEQSYTTMSLYRGIPNKYPPLVIQNRSNLGPVIYLVSSCIRVPPSKIHKTQNFRAARAELRRSFIREILSTFEFGTRSFIEGVFIRNTPVRLLMCNTNIRSTKISCAHCNHRPMARYQLVSLTMSLS